MHLKEASPATGPGHLSNTPPHTPVQGACLSSHRSCRGQPLLVVVQSPSCVLHDPMDCSTSGFPVLHYLLEFPQETNDAI